MSVLKLEGHTILNIPAKTVSEMDDALKIVETFGVRVDCIDIVFFFLLSFFFFSSRASIDRDLWIFFSFIPSAEDYLDWTMLSLYFSFPLSSLESVEVSKVRG